MKKNKVKGFTLIELLAVIVILAIIALIATPIVLSIINESKESAQLRSAEMYLKGVETSVATAILDEQNVTSGKYPIMNNGNVCLGTITDNKCKEEETLVVEMNGETPTSGTVTIESGKVKDLAFTYSNGKTIVKNSEGKLAYEEESTLTCVSLGNYQHQASDGTVEYHDTESGNCSKCGETVLPPGATYSDGTFKSWDVLMGEGIVTETSVSEWGFADQTNLISVVTPRNLARIEAAAFHSCYGLESVTMPNSVSYIGESTFDSCHELESFTFPSSISSINTDTFAYTNNLKTVTIPVSVVRINDCAFNGSNVNTIIYTGTKEDWGKISLSREWYSYENPEITIHCTDGDIIIPAS